jgi:hypothetical protein
LRNGKKSMSKSDDGVETGPFQLMWTGEIWISYPSTLFWKLKWEWNILRFKSIHMQNPPSCKRFKLTQIATLAFVHFRHSQSSFDRPLDELTWSFQKAASIYQHKSHWINTFQSRGPSMKTWPETLHL